MVSWLNHVDKAFIFKSQCELRHLFFLFVTILKIYLAIK